MYFSRVVPVINVRPCTSTTAQAPDPAPLHHSRSSFAELLPVASASLSRHHITHIQT